MLLKIILRFCVISALTVGTYMFLRSLRREDVKPPKEEPNWHLIGFYYGFNITQRCLMHEIEGTPSYEKFWTSFPLIAESCLAVLDLNMTTITVNKFTGKQDTLFQIAPSKNDTQVNMVTIGGSRDEELETKMLRLMEIKHHYVKRLDDINDLFTTNRVIDQIFYPVESIASPLIDNIFEMKGFQICQINIQIHASSDNNWQLIYNFIRDAVKEGRYLPLMAHWRNAQSMRIYFLNIRDPACQERYFYHAFAWRTKPQNQTI